MKESMEDPSMNLIYQSLDPRDRYNVQSGIEGVLSQIGVFTAGLFLAVFVMISFVEIFHVTYVLFVFLVVWFFVGLALYRSYLRMLKVTLESDRIKDTVDLNLEEMVRLDMQQTAFPMELLEFNPYYFHYTSRDKLLALVNHSNASVRGLIWDHLLNSSPGLPQLTISQLLVREKEPDIKVRIRLLGQRKLRSRLGLQEAFIREFPNIMRAGRDMDDFTNYLKSELETYSDKTLVLLRSDVDACRQAGGNMSLEVYESLAGQSGYASLDEMEKDLK